LAPANPPIKIITGFLGTAWIVVAILVIYYVVFYDPTLDPFSNDPHQVRTLARPNPIDMVFYNAKIAFLRDVAAVVGGGDRMSIDRLGGKLRSRVGREIFTEVSLKP
jgi:hypothetical protein